MAFTTNVPNANQRISATQQPIKDNFGEIDTLVNVNHVGFNTGDAGKHKFLQMPEQGAAPTTAANEVGLYAAVGATSTVSELVFRREKDGTSIAFTEGALAQPGWTRLPSGILLKWGQGQGTGSFTHTVSQGPAFAAVYSVQVSDWGNVTTDLDRTIRFRNFTLPQSLNLYASFRTSTGATLAAFQYLIIGS